jgi:hypothetical protein
MRYHEFSRRTFLKHAGASAGASLTAAGALAQEPRAEGRPTVPPVRHHPADELDDGRAADPAAWAAVGPGLNISFASRNSSFLKHAVPAIAPVRQRSETAWRGERVNVLALAWASEKVSQLRLLPGPLKNEKGAAIAAENVRVRFVRYVASDHDFASLETGCGESGS